MSDRDHIRKDDDEFIRLPGRLSIPLSELEFEVARGGGPGGQNVNKVNSKVRVRFGLARSPSLPDEVKARLLAKLASKLSGDGEILIAANEYRDQPRNREAAIERLRHLLADALFVEKARRATKPTRGSVERRIQARKHRSSIKKLRGSNPRDD